jgi:hypothetical protein
MYIEAFHRVPERIGVDVRGPDKESVQLTLNRPPANLTLHRPAKLSALTPRMFVSLHRHLEQPAIDPDVRCLVLDLPSSSMTSSRHPRRVSRARRPADGRIAAGRAHRRGDRRVDCPSMTAPPAVTRTWPGDFRGPGADVLAGADEDVHAQPVASHVKQHFRRASWSTR